MVLVAKKVEKMIKIFQIFFSEKKNINRVQRPSFIKKVQKLAILALSLQDIKNLLCQKMALTVNVTQGDHDPRGKKIGILIFEVIVRMC